MPKQQIWIHKASSFEEAEAFDEEYYAAMSPEERLDTVQYLREIDYNFKGKKNEGRKRLQRVVRVIQQT